MLPTWAFLQSIVIIHGHLRRVDLQDSLPQLPLRRCAQEMFAGLATNMSISDRPTGISGLNGVVVQHYAPLTDRRSAISENLKKLGIDAESGVLWNTAFDDMSDSAMECLQPKAGLLSEELRKRGTFSLVAKSFLVYFVLAQMDEATNMLILEDDVDFKTNASSLLRTVLDSVQGKAYDMIFIGSCLGMKPGAESCKATDHLYLGPPSQASACANAYMVRPAGARKMLRVLEEGAEGVRFPADLQINRMFQLQGNNTGNYFSQPFFAFADGRFRQATHIHDVFTLKFTNLTDVTNHFSRHDVMTNDERRTRNTTTTGRRRRRFSLHSSTQSPIECPLEPLHGSNAH